MLDTNNLSDYLKGLADAIRYKDNSTDKIPAVLYDDYIYQIKSNIKDLREQITITGTPPESYEILTDIYGVRASVGDLALLNWNNDDGEFNGVLWYRCTSGGISEDYHGGFSLLYAYDLTAGMDTSDADATAEDIVKDKTAYVDGKKITGTIEKYSFGELNGTSFTEDRSTSFDEKYPYMKMHIPFNKTIIYTNGVSGKMTKSDIADAIDLTADKIVEGNTILDIEGTGKTNTVNNEDVFIFDTKQDLINDSMTNTHKLNALAVVGNNNLSKAVANDTLNTVVLPKTVILESPITDTILGKIIINGGTGQWDFTVTLTPTSYVISRSDWTVVTYTSTDGITYNRTTELINDIFIFDLVDQWMCEWENDILGNFIYLVLGDLSGVYHWSTKLNPTKVTFYKNPRMENDKLVMDTDISIDSNTLLELGQFIKENIFSDIGLAVSEYSSFVLSYYPNYNEEKVFDVYLSKYDSGEWSPGWWNLLLDNEKVYLGGNREFAYAKKYRIHWDSKTFETINLIENKIQSSYGIYHYEELSSEVNFCLCDLKASNAINTGSLFYYPNTTPLVTTQFPYVYDWLPLQGMTALVSDVVVGKTFIGHDGEKQEGGMLELSGINSEASYVDTQLWDNMITLCGTTGVSTRQLLASDAALQVRVANSMLASAIGLTPDKIKAGETILGITGTYKEAGGVLTQEEYDKAVETANEIKGNDKTSNLDFAYKSVKLAANGSNIDYIFSSDVIYNPGVDLVAKLTAYDEATGELDSLTLLGIYNQEEDAFYEYRGIEPNQSYMYIDDTYYIGMPDLYSRDITNDDTERRIICKKINFKTNTSEQITLSEKFDVISFNYGGSTKYAAVYPKSILNNALTDAMLWKGTKPIVGSYVYYVETENNIALKQNDGTTEREKLNLEVVE
ncbi:MAG: hypothetical protein K2P14_10265 [Anaeroplasmataceae bacterium]|nr:hypothetical protein [Anaeroplasmataceae bacterium]